MHICIIGNSHAGALKEGWDEIATDHPGIQVTFFAARSARLEDLAVQDGVLRATGPDAARLSRFLAFTSGGLDHIAGDAYDLFVVYACNLGFINLPLTYSQAVLQACTADHARETMHYALTEKLRKITARPIFGSTNPLRKSWPKTETEGVHPYERVLAAFQEVYDPLDLRFVAQPEETRDAENRTLGVFATGAKQLDVGRGAAIKGPDDNTHMNAAYGRIWLTQFLETLRVSADQ